MRVFQFNRFFSATVCIVALCISTVAIAQVSSTEQAVMDKILKLKADIDELMMKPGSSSDKAAMDKVLDMKKDIDTFLALLPPHLQKQVQEKMKQSSSGGQSDDALTEQLPFVMTPQEIQQVEMALMRSQLNVLKRIAMALRQGGTLDAKTQAQWIQFVESVSGSGMETDVSSMTKYVIKEAYADQNKDLASLGDKLREHRDLRTKIRDEIAKVKSLVDAVPSQDGPLPKAVQTQRLSLGLDGKMKLQPGAKASTKSDAVAYLEELNKHLSTINENAEQTTLELQEALLKQESKLKAMSDVSQKLQDAGKAAVQGQ